MFDHNVAASARPDAYVVSRSLAPWKCPHCGSSSVRRAHFQSRDEAQRHFLTSPYRCEKCNKRFWLLSRKARYATITILALVIVALIIVTLTIVLPELTSPLPEVSE